VWIFEYVPQHYKGQVRQTLPCLPAAAPRLSRLQAIAEDPMESSRGLLLGHFSSTQMALIESIFVTMGEPDPWGCIIKPLWAASSNLSGLLIQPMWRRRGMKLQRPTLCLHLKSSHSLPNATPLVALTRAFALSLRW